MIDQKFREDEMAAAHRSCNNGSDLFQAVLQGSCDCQEVRLDKTEAVVLRAKS